MVISAVAFDWGNRVAESPIDGEIVNMVPGTIYHKNMVYNIPYFEKNSNII